MLGLNIWQRDFEYWFDARIGGSKANGLLKFASFRARIIAVILFSLFFSFIVFSPCQAEKNVELVPSASDSSTLTVTKVVGTIRSVNVINIVDTSGSMTLEWDGTTRIAATQNALVTFNNLLHPDVGDRVGLVNFGGKVTTGEPYTLSEECPPITQTQYEWAEERSPLTDDINAVNEIINSFELNLMSRTPLAHAIHLGNLAVLGNGSTADGSPVLIIASDGVPNIRFDGTRTNSNSSSWNEELGEFDPTHCNYDAEMDAIERANAAKAAGIEIFTIAFGSTEGEPLLRHVASMPTESHFFIAAEAGDLENIYQRIREITDPNAFATPSDTITYSIKCENTGAISATNIVLTDTIPDYTDFVTATYLISGTSPCTLTGNVVTCSLGTLPTDSEVILNFVVRVTDVLPAGIDGIINEIYGIRSDNALGGMGRPVTLPVISNPDLYVSKVDSLSGAARPGEYITYTLTYTNQGNANATGVIITDHLPSHTSFISASVPYSEEKDLVELYIGEVAGGGVTGSLELLLKLDIDIPVTFTQIGNIDYEIDSTAGHGRAGEPVYTAIEQYQPNLQVKKVSDRVSLERGEEIEFTIYYTNAGDGFVTGVVLTDTLPDALIFDANSTWQLTDTSQIGVYEVGRLAPGGYGAVTLKARVAMTATNGEYTNRVTISDDGARGEDIEPLDNSAEVTMTVNVPTPTPSPSATPTPSPTSSDTPTPSTTPSPTQTPTPSPTETYMTPTGTPVTATPSDTPTSTSTPTITPTPTDTATPTLTPLPRTTGIASYNGVEMSDTTIFLPRVQRQVDDWYSTIYIQNASDETTAITMTYYLASGKKTLAYTDTITSPYTTREYALVDLPELGTTFDGAVIVQASQPIGAVVYDRHYAVNSDSWTAYTGITSRQIGKRIAIGDILNDKDGWNTYLVIQNTANTATDVTLTPSKGDNWGITIPAYGTYEYNAAISSNLSTEFDGWFTLSANKPIAAVARNVKDEGNDSTFAVRSVENILVNSPSFAVEQTKLRSPEARGVAPQEETHVKLENAYIRVDVDNDGQFVIGTTGGDPTIPNNDDYRGLLHGYSYGYSDIWSSFATLRVQLGEVYRDYTLEDEPAIGGSGLSPIIRSFKDDGNIETWWRTEENVQVIQRLSLAFNPYSGYTDTVKIAYEITNHQEQYQYVGIRCMLDVKVGENDAAPYFIPGMGSRVITSETEFRINEIPTYWKAFESQDYAGDSLKGQGILVGAEATKPDRFIIARLSEIIDSAWNYTVSPNSPIDDSATAIYWSPVELAPSQTITFTTYYGLAGRGGGSAWIDAPTTVECDNLTFDLDLWINNTTDFSFTNPIATINLPAGLSTAELTKTLENVPPGGTVSTRWQVAVDGGWRGQLPYTVTIDFDGSTEPLVANSWVIGPGCWTIYALPHTRKNWQDGQQDANSAVWSIANLGIASSEVRWSLHDRLGVTKYAATNTVILHDVTTIDLGEFPIEDIEDDLIGSAYLESLQPLLVVARWAESANYRGVTTATKEAYLPLLSNREGLYSAIHIQNLGTRSVDVEVQYYDYQGELTSTREQIAAQGNLVFGSVGTLAMPNDFVGSARVVADQPVAVAVDLSHYRLESSPLAYRIYLPLILKPAPDIPT